MQPVEIEYLMRENITETSKKVGNATKNLGKSVEQVTASITERIAQQKQVVKQIEEDLKSLNKQYKKMAPGQAQNEMRAEINACKIVLDEERGALTQLDQEHKKNTASAQKLTTQLRQLQNELAQMRLRGEQNTEQYREMSIRAAELSDTIGDLRTQTKILANDDANWEGFASGVNGVSGALTAGTGVMSLFVGENEDLVKIQTKLQSVMAITMGMQQVFNALNKDSAFRLVTVRKAKDFLTAANTRLAVSLGISNVAATALMATLTLGLSAVVTGLVVAWDKWSDAQAKAREEAKQLIATEESGREIMVKTRFELETTRNSLKNFNGTRAEEKRKVEELNGKYGEAFGYYESVAEWYDVLTKKSEQYIQMLFMQAKVQSLVNEIVEADKEVTRLKAEDAGDVEGSMGWLKKRLLYFGAAASNGSIDAKSIIKEHNKRNKADRIKIAEGIKKNKEEEAAELVKNIAKISETFDIGGHRKPGKTTKHTSTNTIANDINKIGELELKARKKIEDNYIALMQEGYEREAAQAKLNFEREKERIEDEEKERFTLIRKLRKSGVKVHPDAEKNIVEDTLTQKKQASKLYANELQKIMKKRIINSTEDYFSDEDQKFSGLLDKYKSFADKRLEIEETYAQDVKELDKQRTAINAAQIDAAKQEAARARNKALKEVNDQELNELKDNNSFLVSLFEDTADKSIGEIDGIIEKVRLLLQYMNAKKSVDGTAAITDKRGNVVRQITTKDIADMGMTTNQLENLKQSPESLKALLEQYDKLKASVIAKNPFKALANAVKDLLNSKENGGGTEKKVMRLGESAAASASIIGDLAGKVADMFEAAGNEDAAETARTVENVMGTVENVGKGFAQGGLVGGIAAAAGEAIGYIGKAFSATARHQAAINQIMTETLAYQREYNLLLMQQNLEYERGATIFGTDGYGKAINAVRVLKQASEELDKTLKTRTKKQTFFDILFASFKSNKEKLYAGLAEIEIVTGHKKTGLFGWGKGRDVFSSVLKAYPNLIKANGEFDISVAEVIMKTHRMSDESKASLQNMISLAKEQKEAWQQVTDYLNSIFGELGTSMTNALVDAFRNGTDAGQVFVNSVEKMLEKLGADLIYSAVLQRYFADAQKEMDKITKNGDLDENARFAAYADVLNTLTEGVSRDSGRAQALLENFKKSAKGNGFDIYKADKTTQTGRAGSLETLTQEQGTKLEGLMTSGQIHLASIDTELEDVSQQMGTALNSLKKIEEYTSHCTKLDDIAEIMEDVKRNGVKVK